MQLYGENIFFISLAVILVPAFILGYCEKPLKHYGMAATVFFVVMTMKDKPQALLYMLCFVWYEYILAQIFLRITTGEHGSRFAYPAFLGFCILPLALHKILIAMNGNAGILAIIGISYMTFKAAQIIIEISDGIIKELKPDEYIYLMIFFPTLLSGPIDRSRRFEEDIRRTIPREEYLEMAGNGLLKILLGMVYKLAIASVFYLLMKKFGMDHTLISAAIYMYTYGFYLFFDFAGYSLMAVGTGYLLGVKVPDNFNKPFLSKDIQEFWNRWHITLSHWLRDYVFSRITMDLIRSGKVKDKLTIASIALMINMLIMGCWHGLTGYYILYGLYHGVLLVLFEIIRKKSAFYKKHKKDKWFIAASWFVTLHLVLVGFFIFSGRFTRGVAFLLRSHGLI